MTAEVKGLNAVTNGTNVVVPRPICAAVNLESGDGMNHAIGHPAAAMEIDAAGPMRGPPMQIVQAPERGAKGVTRIFDAALGIVARFLKPIGEAVGLGGGGKGMVKFVVVSQPGRR